MNARIYYVIALLALFGSANAAGPHTLDQFLSSFNISNSVISSLTYVNITYNNGNYLLAYSSNSPYLLINATSGFTFVLNPTSISSIISATIVKANLKEVNTTYLLKSLQEYNKSSSAPLLDCLQETGLNQPNASCTSQNFCESCRTVPVCAQVLSGVGYGSSFTIGIGTLQTNYSRLESNISLYLSSVALLNAGSAQGIGNINKAFANISSITQSLYQNPVFPPPQNANYALCSPSKPATSQPWFCSALGFCQFLTYNYTILGNLQNYLNKIGGLTLSSSQVYAMAQGISTNENNYTAVILASDELKQMNAILNTTLSGYNGIATGSAALLLNINNATLATKLSTVKANYTLLLTSYTTVNMTKLSNTIARQYAALKSVYLQLNASYSSAVSTSRNNTALLLELESESSVPQQPVVALSIRETQLSSQLSSKPSDINSLSGNLTALNTEIKAVPHNSNFLADMARAIGAPLASAFAGSGSFSSGVKEAPLISIIPAIIIAAIILIVFYRLFHHLNRRQRIRMRGHARRNWRILSAAVVIVLLIYIIMAYSASVTANGSAPLSAATAAIQASSTVAVAINGTSNPSLVSCENTIASSLANEGKRVIRVTMSGGLCGTVSGAVQTPDQCLAQYASSGVPVIILTNSSFNTLTAYSFYGTILSQSGNQQFTDSCLASLFLK
ncbi:MAG: hypothetical protein ACYCO0_02255 [Candidatus Micrarchaeaceae archaeon]